MYYNGTNSYLFLNGTKIIIFKAKDSETKVYSLCLGNISKDWSNDNMKKKQDLMVIFMILVQIIMLLMLIILKIYAYI